MYIENKGNYFLGLMPFLKDYAARNMVAYKNASVSEIDIVKKRELELMANRFQEMAQGNLRVEDFLVKDKAGNRKFLDARLKKFFVKRNQETDRKQFDPVAISKLFLKQGFGIVEMVNCSYNDIVCRKGKVFNILFRSGNYFALLQDDLLESGTGSSMKIYFQYFDDKNFSREELIKGRNLITLLRLIHNDKQGKPEYYLARIDRALRYLRVIMDESLRHQCQRYISFKYGGKINIPKHFK